MVTSRKIDRDDAAEAAATIRRLLDAVARGELSAGSGLVARLEGAAEGLDAIGGIGTLRPDDQVAP